MLEESKDTYESARHVRGSVEELGSRVAEVDVLTLDRCTAHGVRRVVDDGWIQVSTTLSQM